MDEKRIKELALDALINAKPAIFNIPGMERLPDSYYLNLDFGNIHVENRHLSVDTVSQGFYPTFKDNIFVSDFSRYMSDRYPSNYYIKINTPPFVADSTIVGTILINEGLTSIFSGLTSNFISDIFGARTPGEHIRSYTDHFYNITAMSKAFNDGYRSISSNDQPDLISTDVRLLSAIYGRPQCSICFHSPKMGDIDTIDNNYCYLVFGFRYLNNTYFITYRCVYVSVNNSPYGLLSRKCFCVIHTPGDRPHISPEERLRLLNIISIITPQFVYNIK